MSDHRSIFIMRLATITPRLWGTKFIVVQLCRSSQAVEEPLVQDGPIKEQLDMQGLHRNTDLDFYCGTKTPDGFESCTEPLDKSSSSLNRALSLHEHLVSSLQCLPRKWWKISKICSPLLWARIQSMCRTNRHQSSLCKGLSRLRIPWFPSPPIRRTAWKL